MYCLGITRLTIKGSLLNQAIETSLTAWQQAADRGSSRDDGNPLNSTLSTAIRGNHGVAPQPLLQYFFPLLSSFRLCVGWAGSTFRAILAACKARALWEVAQDAVVPHPPESWRKYVQSKTGGGTQLLPSSWFCACHPGGSPQRKETRCLSMLVMRWLEMATLCVYRPRYSTTA